MGTKGSSDVEGNVDAICPPSEDAVRRARELVLAHGWNATAFQIVNPGFDLWFSDDGQAVVGSMRSGRTRVVAGAPVCSLSRLDQTVEEFETFAAGRGERVCYFGAAGRVHRLLSGRPGYSTVVLGAQPVWTPVAWLKRNTGDASIRAQFNRAANKGVKVEEWETARATAHPQLKRLLDEWLEARGLPPLHFLIEPETLGRLECRRVFVAAQDDTPVGFTVLSPVPRRNGWLTEQFVRGRRAPNGSVELMLNRAAQALAAEGADYYTMGLVPLSHHQEAKSQPNPPGIRLVLSWVRAHGRRFYNFDGLERFKSKLHPESWESIYAISKEPRFSFRTLHAIASVFAGGSPAKAVAKGIAHAARQEAKWFVRGLRNAN